jgi:hypothetical protein
MCTMTMRRSAAQICDGFVPLLLLERVVCWKLRHQQGRRRALREQWTERAHKRFIQVALRPPVIGDEDDTTRRVRTLEKQLPGVGVPTATAILAITYPRLFGAIDSWNWKALTGQKRDSFGCAVYYAYLQLLRKWASYLTATQPADADPWLVQDVDLAIWHYHDQHRNNACLRQ